MSFILGLGTTAQVGKDMAALHLETLYPDAKRVAFADKLKQIAMLLFGLTHDQCYGPVSIKEKVDLRYNMTPREILQGIGDHMRKIYPDIWVDTVFNVTIPELQKKGYTKFIISDCRYPNEALKIKKEGGILVKINRNDSGVSVGKQHPSETSMNNYKDYDYTIENNGTREQFLARIESLVEEVGWQKLNTEMGLLRRAEA